MQTVQGYEFDDQLKFDDEAILVLGMLRVNGCIFMEFDDSPRNTVQQMREAAKEGYFDVFTRDDDHRMWVIETDRFDLISGYRSMCNVRVR